MNEALTSRDRVQAVAIERAAGATGLRQAASEARRGAATAGKRATHLEGVAKRVGERLERLSTLVDQYRLYLDGPQKGVYHRAATRFALRSFIEPKPRELSQDAVASAPERGVFAIADGVSESDFSGEFARTLVRRFAEQPPEGADDFGRWLKGAQREWAAQTEALVVPAKTRAWYEPAEAGQTVAHAAFVGARLTGQPGHERLELLGNGDSVAVLVRKGKIAQTFPLTDASQFLNKVKALPSRGDSPHALLTASWKVKPGDEVFLTTDALGAWLLGLPDGGRAGLEKLRGIDSQETMKRFVKSARGGEAGPKMVVDDTAFVRFVVPAGAP
jgi:hypothetical protein